MSPTVSGHSPIAVYFREYLSYDALRTECDRIVASFPSWCTVETKILGHSEEGRELFVIHVWPRGRGKAQPTLWVDANMHAGELIGTNVVPLPHWLELPRRLPGSPRLRWPLPWPPRPWLAPSPRP